MTAPSRVLIVGSGPAGVSAAWPLLEAGVPVLMIDASMPPALPAPPVGDISGFRGDVARWETQFGRDFRGLAAAADRSPKLATPMARAALAGFAEANGIAVHNFLALGSLSRGGMSTIWGAVAQPYDNQDLAGFPFGRSALSSSYDRVMRRIGVSGPAAEHLPGVTTGPPAAPPILHLLAAAGTRGLRPGVTLETASNAVLMEARNGREGCASCGLCLWGCARGSIYASGEELPALQRFPHFEYRSGTRALRLLTLGGLPAVEVAPGATVAGNVGQGTIAAARILLAAGTIATTALVLRSLGSALSSVRLLTNPAAAMAFLMPSLIAKSLPERSFSLAQLAYRLQLGSGDNAAGMLYAADTLPLADIAARVPLSRPVALRLSRALAPALVLATCYLPGRYSSNTMRLVGEDDCRQVVIEGQSTAEAAAALCEAGRLLGRTLRRLGAWALRGSLSHAPPGADAHYAGTFPMGAEGMAGSNILGELNALPGVHVVDGAALSDLPARHCTLTIMANADRIARGIIASS
jgi:choline dehydrogenase-like flavoprotein